MNVSAARRVLLCALLLGIAGDALVDFDKLGLGFVLWVLLVIGCAAWSLAVSTRDIASDPASHSAEVGARDRTLLLGMAAVAVVGIVLRDTELLMGLDFLAALAAAALLAWRARGRSLASLRLVDVPVAVVDAGLTTGFGAAVLAGRDAAGDLAADATAGSGVIAVRRHLSLALIGSIFALPVLAVLTGLLGNADPVFGNFLNVVGEFIATDLMRHVITAAALAWFVGGWLRGIRTPMVKELPRVAKTPRVAFALTAPALYATTAVLTLYLGVQSRSLFGGAAFVERTAGLSYADYARGGFFELVAVSVIVLVMLLVVDILLDREDAHAERRFGSVGWVLIMLVSVLMLSALWRMGLYMRFYGLSADRVYAVAAMVWIGAVLALFAMTVLRGRAERLGAGLVAVSFTWLFLLNVVNPQALVARVNLARAGGGKSFDSQYHAERTADAVPALLAGAGQLPAAECTALVSSLRERWVGKGEAAGWRGWQLPRARAERLLTPSAEVLAQRHCVEAPPGA